MRLLNNYKLVQLSTSYGNESMPETWYVLVWLFLIVDESNFFTAEMLVGDSIEIRPSTYVVETFYPSNQHRNRYLPDLSDYEAGQTR